MLNEADLSMTQGAFSQGGMNPGQQAPQDNTFAEFYAKPVQDAERTREEGRPMFKEVPYVRIMVPGDKGNIIDRPVRSNDKARYPQQWAQFEAGQEQGVVGTPLAEWPAVSRSQVMELEFFGVKTVEALAEMPDSVAQKFMGIQSLRQKARLYLEHAAGAAPIEKLTQENEALHERIRALEEAVEGQAQELKAERAQRPAKAK